VPEPGARQGLKDMTLLITGMTVLSWFLWFLLLVSMFFLIAVILLQEGKGGGLAEAFGGVGAETFGVKAHGINKFTAVVGGLFLVLCIVLTKMGTSHDTHVM
jgi:protein translocase SecG subunit